jgi:hypothetical protein
MKRWTRFISQLYQKSYSRYRTASAISRLGLSRTCNPWSEQKQQTWNLNNSSNNFFWCVFTSSTVFNWPWTTSRSYSFEQKKKDKYIEHMQQNYQPLIHSNTCSHTLSPQRAETCQALEKRKHMQIHALLLIRADTSTHALLSWCRKPNKDKPQAFKMCRYMNRHAQFSRSKKAHTQHSTQETEWRSTLSSWNMPTNAQLSSHICRQMLSSRCKPTSADAHACPNMGQQHADNCLALDTSRHTQKHAKLGIRAYTCRPSIRACEHTRYWAFRINIQ